MLRERLLSARFTQLGPVPRISLQLLIAPTHPDYRAVRFHIAKIVDRTQILDYMRKCWIKLVQRPGAVATELRRDPVTRDELVEILTWHRNGRDDFHDGRNNWESVFASGLLEDHVIDWLFARFSGTGRVANSPLVP